MKMITDTPIFRGALSVAIVWIVIFGYITYNSYRQNNQSVYLAAFDVPENYTENCFNEKLEWDNTNPTYRKPSLEETQLCLNLATETYQDIVRSGNSFELRRSWVDFFQRGLAPALTLLIIVAFWRSLASAVAFIGRKYGMWLRYGARKNNDQSH